MKSALMINQAELTLADIDTSDDTFELDHLIGKYGGGHCTSFEFNDDNYAHGSVRCLEYNIVTEVYTGNWENDEGTAVAETESYKERIYVPVHPEMTLDQIAQAIAKEIRDIPQNRFA
ncbi:hypothetical protein GO755_29820 [Spirosoma sp. HMF4905]|uniref:Uncharacterized protein n=1 Tax=Spirosoma arboris TaxID=2682092 RepID=A0A7K1SL19_9BACT|nr:hypothetical protein [Spirosoma arboris]MVM34266.1 hypothetical protein [Spirosoma arboris]